VRDSTCTQLRILRHPFIQRLTSLHVTTLLPQQPPQTNCIPNYSFLCLAIKEKMLLFFPNAINTSSERTQTFLTVILLHFLFLICFLLCRIHNTFFTWVPYLPHFNYYFTFYHLYYY